MEINSNTPSGPLAMVVVLLGGLVLGGYGVYAYTSQSAALDSTETVNATVTATSVDEIPGNNRRSGDDYRPQVSFNYTYEGDSYSSSKLYPSGVTQSAGSRGGAESMLADWARSPHPQGAPGFRLVGSTSE